MAAAAYETAAAVLNVLIGAHAGERSADDQENDQRDLKSDRSSDHWPLSSPSIVKSLIFIV